MLPEFAKLELNFFTIKMKNKETKTDLFLLVKITAFLLVVCTFSVFDAENVSAADKCSTTKPGFACIDTSKVSATGCVTNLCPGSNANKCCSLASVTTCKYPLQQCSANGNYGVCNAANECIDTQAGPIATSVGTTPAGGGTRFTNPLRFATVDEFLTTIMNALQKIIVSLSLLFIVYGAVLYVTSGGGKQTETAKNAITAALVGLAIGMAAPSFLKEIASIIGWGGTTPAALSLSQIAINALNFLLGILGILSLVMLVIGASMYLTSAGDQGRIDTGKNIFKSALLGVIIAMASMVMVSQVAQFFITTPSDSSAITPAVNSLPQ